MKSVIFLLLAIVASFSFTPWVFAQVKPLDRVTTKDVRRVMEEFLAGRADDPTLKDVDVRSAAITFKGGKVQWSVTTTKAHGERELTQIDRALRQLLKESIRRSGLLSDDDVARFNQTVDAADIQITTVGDRTTKTEPRKPPVEQLIPSGCACPGELQRYSAALIWRSHRVRWFIGCSPSPMPVCCAPSRIVRPRGCSRTTGSYHAGPQVVSIAVQRDFVTSGSIVAAVEKQLHHENHGISRGRNNPAITRMVAATSKVSHQLDDHAAARIYFGKGCHAYWCGDYREAQGHLNEAIRLSGEDARPWYFKGFAEAALGESGAMESFARAVVLQARGKPSRREVGIALQRVQGRTRIQLEVAMQQARLLVLQRRTVRRESDAVVARAR